MDRARHLRNYDLHSWSGLAFGIFIYVVALTGCFALFYHEIQSWEDPAKRLIVADELAPINDAFTEWVRENSDGLEIEYLSISYPDDYEPYYYGYLSVHDENDEHQYYERRWRTDNAAVLPERGGGLSEWVLDFHRDLMWPDALGGRTIGRALVGVAGVVAIMSIISGVVAHTKIFQELFTLRFFRSVRLRWQDAHKVIGLWGLPFYSMIAFTGAVLGIVVLLAPIVAVLTFKGDTEALYEAVLGAPIERTGVEMPMISVDDLGRLRHPESDNPVDYIATNNWGDETAFFDVYFDANKEMSIVEGYQISGVSGERIENSVHENLTAGNRFSNAVAPLHYGTFGGVALKFVYFVLGLSLAVITALGMMMWVERRRHGNVGKRSSRIYDVLSVFNTGVVAGLPVAYAAIFYVDKLYFGAEAARLFWTGISFFIAWGAGLVYAQFQKNEYRVTRDLLITTGLLFVGLPVLNSVMTGYSIFSIFSEGHRIVGYVDLTLVIAGGFTAFIAMKLPSNRADFVGGSKNASIETEISVDSTLEHQPAE